MIHLLKPTSVIVLSDNLIARDIGGEILIVPIVAGMVDGDDALYTLNSTGRAIWDQLDGEKSIEEIIKILFNAYGGNKTDIENDVYGFINEMINHSILDVKK